MRNRKTSKEICNHNISHIAFIMDGNGRWARRRLLPRVAGHRAGVKALTATIDNCLELGIKCMTFYAFSTENWKRPKDEVDALFDMFREFLKSNRDTYRQKNLKILALGDVSAFPADMRDAIADITAETAACTGGIAAFAFNYGSRDEIVLAAKKMRDSGDADFTVENFRRYLYTADMPDPDIIIRTSGEMRLSNFLLFQAAYSELYFSKKYWPDFDLKELSGIIADFCKRDRRFGDVKGGE